MRISLPGDLLMSTAFDSSMVLRNQHTIAVQSNSYNNRTNINPVRVMANQRPIIDLLVGMVGVPVLILCAIQLEKHLREMGQNPDSRWIVFALGVGMLVVSLIICGYITHRMGVCIWTGPIDEAGNPINGRNMQHINSQNDILRIVDSLPPSYDSVVKFDIPPPPYDCLVIDMELSKEEEGSTGKELPSAVTSLHM